MANRFPLIVNSSALQIQELAAADNLDLTSSGIVNATSIGATHINVTGVVTATSFSGSGANLTGVAATSNISTNAIVNSGVTTVAAGSASVPSISPTGDTNTGIFFPSADTIAIAEGGAEAARIDSSGRLLVGTSSSFNGGLICAGSGQGTNTPSGEHIKLAPSVNRIEFLDSNSNASDTGSISLWNTVYNNRSASVQLFHPAGNTGGIRFDTHDGTSLTERARIDSSGRLLVGTTFSINDNEAGIGYPNKVQIESSTANEGLTVRNIGNVSRLNIVRLQNGMTSGTNVGYLGFGAHAASGPSIERARISGYTDTSGGAGGYGGQLRFEVATDSAASVTEQMRITRDGSLYVYSVYSQTGGAAPNVVVDATGELFRSTSSIKYKTEVEDLQNSYSDALLNVRPVWYRSTCSIDNPNHSFWGFIAEEVAKIDPRLVHWKTTEQVIQENGSIENVPCEPEPEGVQYDRFVPHLLNLIKRQKEQIEAMEVRLSALEAQ